MVNLWHFKPKCISWTMLFPPLILHFLTEWFNRAGAGRAESGRCLPVKSPGGGAGGLLRLPGGAGQVPDGPPGAGGQVPAPPLPVSPSPTGSFLDPGPPAGRGSGTFR